MPKTYEKPKAELIDLRINDELMDDFVDISEGTGEDDEEDIQSI